MTIGFIGLGLMGGPMSMNLLRKSEDSVLVYDVNADACQEAVGQGAQQAQDAAALGAACNIVFTMVPKNEHVEAVYAQLLPQVKAGQILVDMSTISPQVSRKIAEQVRAKGGFMLDAPVVKSRPAAIAGELGIYVGGEEAAFKQVQPYLAMMGSNVLHLGENGNGLVMKLCHNALVAQIQNGVNETMALAQKAAGISPLQFAKAISIGGGQNFYLDGKATAIEKRDFTTAFSVENMDKDIHLAGALAGQLDMELPGIDLARQRYEQAIEKGLGKKDFSATYLLQEQE